MCASMKWFLLWINFSWLQWFWLYLSLSNLFQSSSKCDFEGAEVQVVVLGGNFRYLVYTAWHLKTRYHKVSLSVYINESCNSMGRFHPLIFPLKWFRTSVSEPLMVLWFSGEAWYWMAFKHFVSLVFKMCNFKSSNSFSAFTSHTRFWVPAVLRLPSSR